MPEHVETKVIELPWDVSRRLGEFNLTLDGLLRAMKIAQAERRNATEFHPANSAGTFSYHHGVAAIRRELDSVWKTFGVVVFQCLLAWGLGAAVYQIALLI